MTEVIVGTATRSTYKMAANLTQFLNFKANFHQECKLFSKIKMFANNGGHNNGHNNGQHNKKKIIFVSAGTQKYGSRVQPSHVKIPV